MLRTIIGVVAIGLVAGALVLTASDPAAWPSLAMALVFAGGCLFERRYHAGGAGTAPGARFRPTGERFVDPETGLAVTVWSDPVTGERRYVDAPKPPQAG